MSSELYTVMRRVLQISFTPKYPVWLSILLDVAEPNRQEYQLSAGIKKITVDGVPIDHAGLIRWAADTPLNFMEVYVELKVCDNDYLGVHEAHFTAVSRSDGPKTGETKADWLKRSKAGTGGS